MKKSHPDDSTCTVHINVPDDVLTAFDSLYPRCRRRFVVNALRMASESKILFDKIFYSDIFKVDDYGFIV